VDLLQDFTTDLDLLREGLDRARISTPVGGGPVPGQTAGTRLFDAVYLASREKLGQEVGRKAIIIVSDGADTGSRTKEKAAIAASHRSEVIIFAIGITDPRYGSSPRTLRKLAQETGGFSVFPRNNEQLREAFDEIAAQLRTQYLLTYSPTNRDRDGKFRKVKVKVTRKDLKVRTRRGYYAPGERD
jgi:VWFA-related protein